jgi:hypothetical protein
MNFSHIHHEHHIYRVKEGEPFDVGFAFVRTGAQLGSNPRKLGAYLGMIGIFVTEEAITTATRAFITPRLQKDATFEQPGLPKDGASYIDVCISEVESGYCGLARSVVSGEAQFSMLALGLGRDFEESIGGKTHGAIRLKLDIGGGNGTWVLNDDETFDTIISGLTDVTKISLNGTDGRKLTIDFPSYYNYGDGISEDDGISDGFMNPSGSKQARTNILQTHHEGQSVFVDYVFEIPRKGGEYAVFTSSVYVTPSLTPELEPTNFAVEDEDSIAEDKTIGRRAKILSQLPGRVGLLLVIFCCCLCNCSVHLRALRGGKERGAVDLPKGIIPSLDELAAHVDALRSDGAPDFAKQSRKATTELPGHREFEVVLSEEEKRSVYVFDANSAETYVVIELTHCSKGPPLLPLGPSDGERWCPPQDQFIHLATYLTLLMEHLRQEDWSGRILPRLDGKALVRYQAAVPESHWRALWEALLKPFAAQRTAYRGCYKTKRAPDLYFGALARFSDHAEAGGDAAETAPSSESGPGNGGIPFSAAAEWLEFWSRQDLPQQRTFIEFAAAGAEFQRLSQRRSVSAPPTHVGGSPAAATSRQECVYMA